MDSRMKTKLLPIVLTSVLMGACGSKDRVDEVAALEGDPANGATVFADNCSGCHGADGSGGSGPNLQGEDDREEIIEVVLYGEESMPGFDGDLSDQEIADVADYVAGGFEG